MKYCSKCGQQIADDAAFCMNCGTPVGEPIQQQAPQQPSQPQDIISNQPVQQAPQQPVQPQGYVPNQSYQTPQGFNSTPNYNNYNNYNNYQQGYNPYQPANNDAPHTGFAVLGFFIPIVGLVLYLIWKDKTPLKAKSAGKGALIGFIVNIVLTIISTVIGLM